MPFACYTGEKQELERDTNKLSSKLRYSEPFFDQKGTICLDRTVKWVFLGLLFMLQVLSIVWFGMIIKVALKVVKGEGANDSRSSDEEEEEEDEIKQEAEILKETLDLKKAVVPNRLAKFSPSGKARASGSEATPLPRQTGLFQTGAGRIRVPGSRDRKELIGRVGCNG